MELAEKLREARRSGDRQRQETLKRELERAVRAAFQLRQQMYKQRASELRDRLERIEDAVARRAEAEDEIVARRIRELSDDAPDPLEWAPSLAGEPAAGLAIPPIGTGMPQGLPHAAVPIPSIAAHTPSEDIRIIERAAGHVVRRRAELSEAYDLALKHLEAQRSVRHHEQRLAQAQQEAPTERESVRGFERLLDDAHAKEEATAAMLQGVIRLMELDVQRAELDLKAAVQQLDQATRLREKGLISEAEFHHSKAAADRARLEYDRVSTELEVLRRIARQPNASQDEEADSPDSDAADAAPDSQEPSDEARDDGAASEEASNAVSEDNARE